MSQENTIEKIFVVALSLTFLVEASSGAHGPACTRANKTLDDVVNCIRNGYDQVQRPYRGEKALNVSVGIVVISFGHLDDLAMEFSLEFYMRHYWQDPLLRFTRASLPYNSDFAILDELLLRRIWRPDSYVENLKSLKVFPDKGPFINQGFRLYPDGNIFISTRVSATLYCAMDLRKFPMDKQTCSVKMSSYFFTTADLMYNWQEIGVYKDVALAQFDFLGFTNDSAEVTFTTGVYRTLEVEFTFRRRLQTYMLGFYIPTTLTVMISWLSFFISPNSAPARCALGIITVLAVGGFLTSQRKSFPTVSYVMAADLYILVCYVFVFCALLEYTVVHYFLVYDKQMCHLLEQNNEDKDDNSDQDQKEEISLSMEEIVETNKSDKPVSLSNRHPLSTKVWIEPFNNTIAPETKKLGAKKAHGWFRHTLHPFLLCPLNSLKKCFCGTPKALVIEKVSRILFPMSFMIFNIIYWPMYLAEHQHHHEHYILRKT